MNADTVPPFSMPSPPLRPTSKGQGKGLFIGLSAIVILVLIGSGLAAIFLYRYLHPQNPPPPTGDQVVGHAFFASSGQWSDVGSQDSNVSSQGDNDRLQIELHNLPAPDPGKSYYAWLLSDKAQNPMVPILLGALPFDHGNVDFTYQGDSQHTNLLATSSRLLITEENQQSTPTQPSNVSLWRYYAELPQESSASGASQSTVLSSVRALLYQEPHLKALGIHDGLDIQLLRNTGKVLEWIVSARDATEIWGNHDAGFIHRQIVRALDYLDGNAVQADAPGTPLIIDPGIPLLDVTPNQGAISYLGLIHEQLKNLVATPDATQTMHMLASESDQALMGQVLPSLMELHQLTRQLVFIPETQLLSPAALGLLDEMITLANVAFVGMLDPSTNNPQPGVVQIFYLVQRLAAYDIKPYKLH